MKYVVDIISINSYPDTNKNVYSSETLQQAISWGRDNTKDLDGWDFYGFFVTDIESDEYVYSSFLPEEFNRFELMDMEIEAE